MDCNIILDLLPLYVDECCSMESGSVIQEHVEKCPGCKRVLEQMQAGLMVEAVPEIPAKLSLVNDWKASVLQSIMLFASFSLIVLGVTGENAVKTGMYNGLWSFLLIIPATGQLLSLTSWYFVRLFKSRRQFVLLSAAFFLTVTVCGYSWAVVHYGTGGFLWFGLGVTAVCGAAAVFAAQRFAQLLGKE